MMAKVLASHTAVFDYYHIRRYWTGADEVVVPKQHATTTIWAGTARLVPDMSSGSCAMTELPVHFELLFPDFTAIMVGVQSTVRLLWQSNFHYLPPKSC
jgi:hypothetical protein